MNDTPATDAVKSGHLHRSPEGEVYPCSQGCAADTHYVPDVDWRALAHDLADEKDADLLALRADRDRWQRKAERLKASQLELLHAVYDWWEEHIDEYPLAENGYREVPQFVTTALIFSGSPDVR